MSEYWEGVTEPSAGLTRRARYALAIGVAIILFVLLGLEYRQIQRQAQINLENINTGLRARLDDGLLIPLEHKLAVIAAGLRSTSLPSISANDVERVKRGLNFLADVEGIVITDVAGNVLIGVPDQGVDYPKLFASESFAAGSAINDTRLAIDAPHRLLLAVPIKGQSERLTGWVVGGTSLDSIRLLLADVSLGERGVVTLRLASQPASIIRIPEIADPHAPLVADDIDEAMKKHIAKGTTLMDSRIDGVERLYSFTRIGSFELVLLTGMAVSDYLSGWYWTLVTSLSITAALLVWIFRSDLRLIKARERERFVQAALQDSVDNTELLLHSVGQAIVGVDISGQCTFCNPASLKLFGVEAEELIGHSINPYFCSSKENLLDLTSEILAAVVAGQTFQLVCDSFQNATGVNCPVEVFAYPSLSRGEVIGGVLVLNDVSGRREAERALAHLAYHDTLTGLPNRNGFEEHVKALLVDKGKSRETLSIAYIDIDGFRHINESLGQAFGDAVLKEVAKRLKSYSQLTAAARLSGDLFAAVIPSSPNASNVALALQAAIKRPWTNGLEMPASISIGLACFPDNGFTFESLSAAADVALNSAKLLGHNSIRLYDRQLGDASARRFDIQKMLSSAISRGELFIEYQPKIDLLLGKVYGAEALLRWVHPVLGKISPSEFIPIAETNGLIIPITEWVINNVCAQIAAWERHGRDPIQISVNFAAMHFKRGHLYETVRCALERHTVQPSLLELELTENSVVEDSEFVVGTLKKIRQLGVQLSIDDFGTGYSNLAYLKRFNPTALKVDRSFVTRLPEDGDSASIVQAIISLARELKLDVVAEGVESAESLKFLKDLGCSKIQGYFYSPSLTPGDFENYVIAFNSLAPTKTTTSADSHLSVSCS